MAMVANLPRHRPYNRAPTRPPINLFPLGIETRVPRMLSIKNPGHFVKVRLFVVW